MLESIINLSAIIRMSPEGVAWQTAWENIRRTNPDIPSLAGDAAPEFSPGTLLSIFCNSERVEARPVMLPFLMVNHPIIQDYPGFIKALKQNSELSIQYDLLVKRFIFFSLVIGHLRSIAPGYPYENLVFTVPGSPWTQLSNIKEIPLAMEKTFIERTNGNLLKAISLEIQSKPDALNKALLILSSNIRDHPNFIRLRNAVENIRRNKNLTNELINTRKYFEQRLGEISQSNESHHLRNQMVSDLASHIYERKGEKILEYVTAFIEYEELIEKIYWLLTQLVVWEKISCLSAGDDNQLQQVTLENSTYPLLTAITKSNARSLAIGQLIYLSISNTDEYFNGLYQVDHLHGFYKAGFGMRYYFKARLLWKTALQPFRKLLENCDIQGLLNIAEPISSPDHFRIEISSETGYPTELELGNPIIDFSLSKTMYLPF